MTAKIVHGLAEERLHDLMDGSVDLTVTSPPYNVDLGNNKFNKRGYAEHNDNIPHDDYIAWLKDETMHSYQQALNYISRDKPAALAAGG